MNIKNVVTILSPAKLNLCLEIIGKNHNNYHLLESFIVFIDLYDKLTFKPRYDSLFKLKYATPSNLLPAKEDNLINKILSYFAHRYRYSFNYGLDIVLDKKIPIGGGLGGGSGNAAATIVAVNKLYSLNLSLLDMLDIGAQFGADIPAGIYYQLGYKSGLMEGIGEKFTPITIDFKLPILIVNPNIFVSTKEVFNVLNTNPTANTSSGNNKIPTDKNGFLTYLQAQTNSLTAPAIKLAPAIEAVLSLLNSTRPILARMTGSGSTCFAIYDTQENLQIAYDFLRKIKPDYFVACVSNL